jgi:hypothetical protein
VDAGQLVVELRQRDGAALRDGVAGEDGADGGEPGADFFQKERVEIGHGRHPKRFSRKGAGQQLWVVLNEPARQAAVEEFRILVRAGPGDDVQAGVVGGLQEAFQIAPGHVAERERPFLRLVNQPGDVRRQAVAVRRLEQLHPPPPIAFGDAEVVKSPELR